MPVMPDKAAFVMQCCFEYSVTGETAIFTSPKAAPSDKERICIFIQTNTKRQHVGGKYDVMLTSTWNGLGLVLEMTFLNDSESTI